MVSKLGIFSSTGSEELRYESLSVTGLQQRIQELL